MEMSRIEIVAGWLKAILTDRFQTTFVDAQPKPEIQLIEGKVMLDSGEQYLIYIEQLEDELSVSAVLWDDTEDTYITEAGTEADFRKYIEHVMKFASLGLPELNLWYDKIPKNMKVSDGTVLVDGLRFFHMVTITLPEKYFDSLTYWELEEAIYLVTNEILIEKLEKKWLEKNRAHYEKAKEILETMNAEYWDLFYEDW